MTLLITSLRGVAGNHPGVYRAFGVEPSDYRMVVTKTASNFQWFMPLTTRVIRVNTPGPTTSEIGDAALAARARARSTRSTSAPTGGRRMPGDATAPMTHRRYLVELYRRMATIREFDTVVPRLVKMGRIKGTAHSAVGPGGGGRRCLRGAPPDRLHHVHAPRPRPRDREGRGRRRDDGRAVRAPDGDLRRQGRLDAPRRLLGRDARRQRRRRRRLRDRDRARRWRSGIRGEDGVVVCFFGDSAINQGAFLENANYAALHRLPVIYLCENNQFAMSMPAARATALGALADRAAGIPMPGVTVDGMDVLAVRDAVAGGGRLGRAPATARR